MKTQTLETVTKNLLALTNGKVIVKLKNGRVISGPLSSKNETYTIKLGALHIALSAENISAIAIHP